MRITISDDNEGKVLQALAALGTVLDVTYDGKHQPVSEWHDGYFRVAVTAQPQDR